MSPNLGGNNNLKNANIVPDSKNGTRRPFQSSFPGVVYSGVRGAPFPNIFDWLQVKRKDDNIGNLWRVHDNLYNLEDFIGKHPGGRDWIEFTQGTDITEAFEASHIVGFKNVEKILEKYYVKPAERPRNSPYTFEEAGFFKTLKRKIGPILKEVGTNSSQEILKIQDGLAITYAIIALLAIWIDSTILQVVAGLVLGMTVVGSHNFFHKRDNFRMYYMDLSPLSSYEWRISHACSHHLYPNTVLDFEIMLSEPLVEFLPSRPKNFIQKYIAILYVEPLYLLYGLSQIIVRIISLAQGKQRLRPENLLIFLELAIFLMIAPSYKAGFIGWAIIFMMSSFWFIVVSNNAAHHHPTNFHDGDEPRPDPDFGLCQLDATKTKSDWFHKPLFSVLTTFGEHPLHHLFPTVCHSKLKYIKPALEETLKEFSETFPSLTQLQLFIGTHEQIGRTSCNPHPQTKRH